MHIQLLGLSLIDVISRISREKEEKPKKLVAIQTDDTFR